MDIDEAAFSKSSSRPLFDNLNIAYNSSNSMVVHWNKYQLFIYENLNFENTLKELTPEYQVFRVLLTNNYLLCVDSSGYLYLTTLKFKNAGKVLTSSYKPRDTGIKSCVAFNQDHSLSLKYDSKTYFLRLNRITSDFISEKTVALFYSNGIPKSAADKYLLKAYSTDQCIAGHMQKIFNAKKLNDNCHLIVLSFDKLTLFGCLFDPGSIEEFTTIISLYSCPSEICDVVLNNAYLHIGLKIGTVIRLPLNGQDKVDTVHLNTALHRFTVVNEAYIYTDGITMCKVDNIFSEITFKQFIVKNVYDFSICGELLLCTTFDKTNHNIAYLKEESYHQPVVQKYSSAENLITNSEYLTKIFEEVDKDKEIGKKVIEEQHYLTALSLSNRQDLMDKVLEANVTVYENYLEVTKEINKLTLTEELTHYFEPEIYLFLLEINITNDQPTLTDAVTKIVANIETKIHITLSNDCQTLKTTSNKVEELKKMKCLIPLHVDPSTEIKINVKLVSKIPGTYDKKQTIWTVLYRKDVMINSENFIRINSESIHCLKEPKESFGKCMNNMCMSQYGDLFELTDNSKERGTYSMYIKCPNGFDPKSKKDYFRKYLGNSKSEYLLQQLSTEEFLKSINCIRLNIAAEKVEISIENDGFSEPQMKVSSMNRKIALDLRNFFSNMFHEDFEPGSEFINSSFYTTVENLQKEVKSCITESTSKPSSFERLAHQFEKNIIGVLPV